MRWFGAGALSAFAVISSASIGLFVLPAALGAIASAYPTRPRWPALAGVAATAASIAALNLLLRD